MGAFFEFSHSLNFSISYPPEVGSTFSVRSLFDQLVNALKVVSHGHTIVDVHHLDSSFNEWSVSKYALEYDELIKNEKEEAPQSELTPSGGYTRKNLKPN